MAPRFVDHRLTRRRFLASSAATGLLGATGSLAMPGISRAADKPVAWHDFHATVLRLLGIDHERLTYYHNGIQRRLTNVHGQVIDDILA